MTKFTITTHKFEHEGEEYFLKPLGGAHLNLLFKVMTEAESSKGGESFSLDTMSDMHLLAVETFKQSYPSEKVEDIEAFVTKNLFIIFEHIISANVNMPKV